MSASMYCERVLMTAEEPVFQDGRDGGVHSGHEERPYRAIPRLGE